MQPRNLSLIPVPNYSNYPANNEVRYSNVVFATQRIGAITP